MIALILIPLSASASLLVAPRSLRPALLYRIVVCVVALTLVSATALLFNVVGDEGPPVQLGEWLPGTGTIEIAANAPKLAVVLLTTFVALVVLLRKASLASPLGSDSRSPAFSLAALGAANAAFLLEHFLARYVALEIVALCVPLAVLAELRHRLGGGAAAAWTSYLLLRVGDAGLLAAILILADATGTLQIGPALAAAEGLSPDLLGAAALCFLLAVWVKMGGWPFHIWLRAGEPLVPPSYGWLYATAVPHLGAYLLYRVTPLVHSAQGAQKVAFWVGGVGALLPLLLSTQNVRRKLAHVGAAQAGFALLLAAAGMKEAIWLWLVAVPLPRLLLFWLAEMVQQGEYGNRQRLLAGLWALGGIALACFDLLVAWWVHAAGAPQPVLFLAQVAVLSVVVRTLYTAVELAGLPRTEARRTREGWLIAACLAMVIIAGLTLWRSIWSTPSLVALLHLPALPSSGALVVYAATSPAIWLAVLGVAASGYLRARGQVLQRAPAALSEPNPGDLSLQELLSRLAWGLRALVEISILERGLSWAVRAVESAASLAYRFEMGALERGVSLTFHTVTTGAMAAYRFVEQEGLEGLLRRLVDGILALSRRLQRWHTGRLRHNLAWVGLGLLLFLLIIFWLGW